jgi:hypothetical protein
VGGGSDSFIAINIAISFEFPMKAEAKPGVRME